jgi:hypothetical protein
MAIIALVDGCEFDTRSGELRRGGTVVRLEPQPAAVLAALASRPGELVTHDELRRAVWDQSTHVKVHDALHYCIRQIRAALGDNPRQPRFIETIPRRGYRLRPEGLAHAPAGGAVRSPRRWLWPAAIAAGLVAAAILVEQRPNDHHQIAVSVLTTLHDLVF